ncbi:hypothetical protein AKN87_03110 [Thiopseudomonas alkaliphila]|nr:hypothetical protein AKN87_03110 [Thiopseudomonas alkaliphila]
MTSSSVVVGACPSRIVGVCFRLRAGKAVCSFAPPVLVVNALAWRGVDATIRRNENVAPRTSNYLLDRSIGLLRRVAIH